MTSASPARWPATDVSLIGDLLRRLNPSDRDDAEDGLSDEAPSSESVGSIRVERLLSRAEAEALAAFRRTGLPDVPGVYQRAAGETDWTPAPDLATATDRFAHVLTRSESGARYASLAQIGRLERPDDPVIALAADLLGQISTVRERLAQGGSGASGRHDLEVAFELTMTWMRLCELAAAPPPKARKTTSGKRKAPASKSRARKPASDGASA